MNTDPLSTLSIRAEMKITERRNRLIEFGAMVAGTAVTGLVAVSCTFSLFSSDAVVAHVFLGTLGALGAHFCGRETIRCYGVLMSTAMRDITRISTLQLENDNFRGRIWDLYLSNPAEREASGDSGGTGRENATLSPDANVITINPRKPSRFQ